MFSFMSQNGSTVYGMVELVADSRSDVLTLPTDCAPGSSCLILEDFSIWMMNSKKQWVESE